MLFEMKCPSCGATMQFDDTKEFMFCPYCGNKVANLSEKVEVNQNINVSGTVYHVQDRSNEPNLYISYNSINPNVNMVTRETCFNAGWCQDRINVRIAHLQHGKNRLSSCTL